MKKELLFLLLFIIVLVACQNHDQQTTKGEYLPYYNEASFTPIWSTPGNISDDFHQIPEFSLLNQEGEVISQSHLDGKITVADFFFTSCPGICPKMTTNMSLVQDSFQFNSDVVLLSYSVTPLQDSVPVLKLYANEKGIMSDKWHLLTGDKELIYKLGRNFYFVEEDLGINKSPDDFLHTENFVLLDKKRHIRGIYNGLNKASVQQLINDIKTLLLED